MKKRHVHTTLQIQMRKVYASGVHSIFMLYFNYKLIPPRLTFVNLYILQGLIAGILCCDFFVPARYISARALVWHCTMFGQ